MGEPEVRAERDLRAEAAHRNGLSYRRAVAALEGALTFGIHPSLDGIRALTEALDRPQDAYACVQVTGTNGKSSVTRMTAAILRAHGLRAGAYTSPHMDFYEERVEIDGAPISPAQLVTGVTLAMDAALVAREAGYHDSITEFELLTAGVLALFRAEGVDVAVLEVGMGGRWDATSVVSPSVSVITGVGIDHAEHLGTTREAIAEDKAHIIKPACAPILGPGTVGIEDIFLRRAEELDSHARAVRPENGPTPVAEELTIRFAVRSVPDCPGGTTRIDVRSAHGTYEDLELAAPSYQAPNAATAVAAAEAALGRPLDASAVLAALAAMRFPGRFELVSPGPPPVVIDGAHNPEAACVLADAIREAFPRAKPTLLLAILADKDAAGIAAALSPVASAIAVTASSSARARTAVELADVVHAATGRQPEIFPDVATAVRTLATSAPMGLVVAGSITTAAEARRALRA